jgi:hypothetical protein
MTIAMTWARVAIRRGRRLSLVGMLCGAAVSAQPSRQPSPKPLAERVGLAFGDDAGGCIDLADSVARAHPMVTVLWPPMGRAGGGDAQVVRGHVGARRGMCPAIDSGYAIDGARLTGHTPYLFVLGQAGPSRIVRDRIEIDLTGDGRPESVRVCTSTEGVHFTVWAGVPFESRRLAHVYASLGYDVESSCRRAEYED